MLVLFFLLSLDILYLCIKSIIYIININHSGTKRKRSYKPGPSISTVQVKLYHLPGASPKPKFTDGSNPLVIQHFQSDYGKCLR